jgi:hypothetical protein
MNRLFLRFSFLLSLLLTLNRLSWGQTTDNRPVQLTPVLQPPFSLHFSDYATNPQLLKVYLLLKDLSKTHIDIYLSLRLQGPGVLIQTRPEFRPPGPVNLQAGLPLVLTGPELSAYFQPNALEVQGLSEAILTQGGQLPEGLYTLTMEAFEWDRQRESVSNQGTSLLTVFLNYPPLLTFPARDSEVPFQNQQNTLFQWVGRNSGTVAWSGQPLYTFRLWELRDEQDPNVAAQSLIPLYEETTGQSSLVYGPALPPLQAGMRYAWQVQARDALGQDVFINQGLSEVSAFKYGMPPIEPAPTDSVKIPPPAGLPITVSQVLDPFSYPVTAGNPDAPTPTLQALLTSTTIQNLLTDSTRIPKCHAVNIDGSNCTETVQVPLPSGEVQGSLNPGDVVIINQYKVLITQATGTAGNFSGQGLLVWNFAGATHVPVSFSNLQVVKAFNSATGGCVTGGTMTSRDADGALVAQLQAIVDQVSPANSFSGTLGEALTALSQTASSPTPDRTAVTQYTSAILQGLTQWKESVQTIYGPLEGLSPIFQEINGLVTSVTQANQCAQTSACSLDQNLLQTTLSARIFIANQQLTDLIKLASDPNGRVAAQENCQLDVTHFDATNLAILTSDRQLLMAHGCVGGTITWSNGTPISGTSSGTILSWTDGETAQLMGGLFTDRALVVRPQTQTIYTAVCRMATGKTCTQSVPVSVSSPDCPPFAIAASATTFERGQTLTLTATGCNGMITWSNGLGTGSQIVLIPTTDFIASATCQDGVLRCSSNTIPITFTPTCLQSMYVQQEKVVDPGLGKTKRERTLAVLGCETGYLSWQKTGTADATVNGRTLVLTDIKGPVSVTVTCTLSGQPPCPPISQTFPEPTPECATLLLMTSRDDATTPPASYTTLYSTFKKPFTLTDAAGQSFTTSPVDRVNVPLMARDNVYTAQFENGCKASLLIPALTYTATWNNYTSGKVLVDPVSRTNDPAAYTADVDAPDIQLTLKSACVGKVIWSSSADPTLRLEAPELILSHSYASVTTARTTYSTTPVATTLVQSLYIPFPTVTTTFAAACQVTTAGTTTVYPALNPKTVVVTSNSCLKLTASTKTLTQGEALTLQAVGCSGTVNWSLAGTVVGIGTTLTHTPLLTTTPGSVSYTASCDNPACSESLIVQVKAIQLIVKAPKTEVAIAEAVSLTATGCSGGLVVWSTGAEGPIITTNPLEQTTYTATCWVNGTNLGQKAVTLSVINTAPDPIECPPFSLTATSATVVRCAGQTITFSPAGCPVGSTVTWSDGHVSAYNESYALVINAIQTVTATCKTPYGIEAVASLSISTVESTLTVSPSEVYAGYPTTLSAFGCSTTDCQEGSYTWRKWNSNEPAQSGPTLQVRLAQPTEYVITCINTGATQHIKINTKDLSCDFRIDPKYYRDGTALLKADQCDLDRPLTWVYYQDANGLGQEMSRNVTNLKVNRPTTNVNGRVDLYIVTCSKSGVPCKGVAFVNPNPDNGGFTDGTGSVPPDAPCTGLGGEETKKAKSPQQVWYLYSDWCPGTVKWYADEGHNQLVTTLTNGARYTLGRVAQTVSYYYNCITTKSPQDPCPGKITIEAATNSGGRVAAETGAEAAGTCAPLTSVALSTAMGVFYSQMLCQTVNLYKGDQEKASAYLANLQTTMNSLDAGILFPTDLSAVLNAIVAGDCQKAAQLLAAPNMGPATEYNDKIRSSFGVKQKEIVESFTPQPTIIFVNGHYSKIIPGPTYGGKAYWNYFDDEHAANAQSYFNVSNIKSDYADGSSLIAIDADYKDRRSKGKSYAEAMYSKWKNAISGNVFYLVAHSEGCGMAAGIADYLLSKNEKIGEMVFLSCDEGAEPLSSVDSRAPTYQIEYMYWDKDLVSGNCEPEFDWVIGTDLRYQTYNGIRGARKFGIVINNNLDFGTVHGSSGNIQRVSPLLRDLKSVYTTQNINGQGQIYNSQSNTLTKFFKINDKIILPNAPQWNIQTHTIDYSLPCNPK